MRTALEVLLLYVALYPVVTAALWIAGGLMFKLLDEGLSEEVPDGGWPGVTVLIPAYNEEDVIGTSVRAALASDYPDLELLVLDDGSTDGTYAAAAAAAAGDVRCHVIRDSVNRGKAERLNTGFALAGNDLVVVTDADAHLHPSAVRHLAARIEASPMVAAVAGAPHVTNRTRLVCAMQVLEVASIIGLIRRTQSLTGRVGIVAGVCGMFRRERVLAVGGYDGRMATEDIDLTWRLLLVGWHTAYEPRALAGMEVPNSLAALWAQRKRWARGQGEVIHEHMRHVVRWHDHRLWLLGGESLASILWVVLLVASALLAVLNAILGNDVGFFGLGLAWGIAISVVATVQLVVGITLSYEYDRWDPRSMLVGAIYPLLYWLASAAASLRASIPAIVRGPRERRVVWSIPRERAASRVARR